MKRKEPVPSVSSGRHQTSGFQRLNSFGLSQYRDRGRNQVREKLTGNPPIEMKSLGGTRSQNNALASRVSAPSIFASVPGISLSHSGALENQNCEDSDVMKNKLTHNSTISGSNSNSFTLHNPNAFQVYNATSEELDADDEALPLALSDVHLTLRQLTVERNYMESIRGNNPGDNENAHRPRTRCPIGTCGCLHRFCNGCRVVNCFPCKHQCWTNSRTLVLCVITFLLITGIAISLLAFFYVKGKHANGDYSIIALQTLRKQQWPLHDVRSQQLNVSYDSIITQSQAWNFDNDDDTNEKTGDDITKLAKFLAHLKTSKSESTIAPKPVTVNGHQVDQSAILSSILYAEGLLKEKLNRNSSKLTTLYWKGLASAIAVAEMRRKLNLDIQRLSLDGVLGDSLCVTEPNLLCNGTDWYRSIDGECNNMIHKSWGSQYSPFRRIINPAIALNKRRKYIKNCCNQVGQTANLHTLPSAETVSVKAHGGTPKADPIASAFLPLWGMFTFHDTVKVAESPVNCCGQTDNHLLSIVKEQDDLFSSCTLESANLYTRGFGNDKGNCSSSMSSIPAWYPSCELEPRAPFNLVTSLIDASNIYGASQYITDMLRSKKFGKLRVHKHGKPSEYFLPKAKDLNQTCYFTNPIKIEIPDCVFSGDSDVNQVVPLIALNTIFVRQHNRIASRLHHVNPHWNDERLFQETRRILIAQIQHITYNEFLPEILGKEFLNISGLNLQRNGYFDDYHPAIDPSVSTVFAGAVGNFWYSMVVGTLKQTWKGDPTNMIMHYDISELIFNPQFIMKHRNSLSSLVRGMSTLNSNRATLGFPTQLRSLPVKSTNASIDMVKIIIQRGRDMDIAPYVEWRKICGFSEVKVFEDLENYWFPDAYGNVTSAFRNIEEIDLFTGMLAEYHVPSGRVGPTLACLLADQYIRFRRGDRFWYEGEVYFKHFTLDQLEIIRETTLARIICDNIKDLGEIQKWPMLLPVSTNPLMSCRDSRIPEFNFHPWKEDKRSNIKYNATNNNNVYDNDWYLESIESHAPSSSESESESQESVIKNSVKKDMRDQSHGHINSTKWQSEKSDFETTNEDTRQHAMKLRLSTTKVSTPVKVIVHRK